MELAALHSRDTDTCLLVKYRHANTYCDTLNVKTLHFYKGL